MPSAAQVLSLVTFFRPVKKDSRLPGESGGVGALIIKDKNDRNFMEFVKLLG
jgi:hypothetical protein